MNSAEVTNKNRCGGTTRDQYTAYLNELRTNKAFRENKFNASDPDIIRRTWDKLAFKLNSLGGPTRDVAGWKRVFTDWKSQTRAKCRRNKCIFKETGNYGDSVKPLTDLEEDLLDITGRAVIEGMQNTTELGFNEPTVLPIESQKQPHEQENIAGNTDSAEDQNRNRMARPPAKKRKSLISSLQDMINRPHETENANEKENTNILNTISKSVREIRVVQKKRLKLRKLELQVKYPTYNFVLTSDSETE